MIYFFEIKTIKYKKLTELKPSLHWNLARHTFFLFMVSARVASLDQFAAKPQSKAGFAVIMIFGSVFHFAKLDKLMNTISI